MMEQTSEKTTEQQIKELNTSHHKHQKSIEQIWELQKEIEKERNVLILQYLKEEKILSEMTWVMTGRIWNDKKVVLEAKENWNKCPEKLVELLGPDYHDHFYFFDLEFEEVKFGIHFSDGDIYISLEIDDDGTHHSLIEFINGWGLKVRVEGMDDEIRKYEKEIAQRKAIQAFVNKVNGRTTKKDE